MIIECNYSRPIGVRVRGSVCFSSLHPNPLLFLKLVVSQMSPEGYVHMSIISRFNRVRALTQDIVAIKEAMVGSTVVEMAPG